MSVNKPLIKFLTIVAISLIVSTYRLIKNLTLSIEDDRRRYIAYNMYKFTLFGGIPIALGLLMCTGNYLDSYTHYDPIFHDYRSEYTVHRKEVGDNWLSYIQRKDNGQPILALPTRYHILCLKNGGIVGYIGKTVESSYVVLFRRDGSEITGVEKWIATQAVKDNRLPFLIADIVIFILILLLARKFYASRFASAPHIIAHRPFNQT